MSFFRRKSPLTNHIFLPYEEIQQGHIYKAATGYIIFQFDGNAVIYDSDGKTLRTHITTKKKQCGLVT